jgi:hypothetical protein
MAKTCNSAVGATRRLPLPGRLRLEVDGFCPDQACAVGFWPTSRRRLLAEAEKAGAHRLASFPCGPLTKNAALKV